MVLQLRVQSNARLTYANSGNSNEVELTLASGEELMAIGYEKSAAGSRVRKSEVYAIISFGQGGHLILEIPNIRADRSLTTGGYVSDARTFRQIETRGNIHTKSFNSAYEYSLEFYKIVPN